MPIPSEYDAFGSDSSLLRMTGVGLTPYSARGLTQTLTPIEASKQLHRTINGELQDFSQEQFQKYASTISGSDQEPPAWDGVWPGRRVVVECVHELSYPTAGGTPARTPVPGSQRIEGAFTFYRPILFMCISNFEGSFEEWAAGETWSVSLEEV
jgi:hypothetical protein